MKSREAARRKRRLTVAIKESMRELSIQLSLLNHQVGARAKLKDTDLDCLDLIARFGPLGPTELSRRAGLHPATITGVLDRLERDRWVTRERDPDDRRAVRVRVLRERGAELLGLYAGMNRSMDDVCSGYSEAELDLISGFLHRVAEAGRQATDELAEG
ncbi:MarR family transcriptional regulator [Amycolatopsis sp. K13G38]|uniref:MarR family transcriptional regulator n=1 Tax=Amycolatopsis acididurans TaxID=2724524 RepID=A0ABX1J912_9PSEU|nr:MarR family transcriptional regulator [Amycolatopsis acididurans]NKQ56282.1 MarR family transcriptional regulator [Amycolatopsis acididurans]